jgi:hypothetical protein
MPLPFHLLRRQGFQIIFALLVAFGFIGGHCSAQSVIFTISGLQGGNGSVFNYTFDLPSGDNAITADTSIFEGSYTFEFSLAATGTGNGQSHNFGSGG